MDFKDITEFALSMALDSCSLLLGPTFDEGHGSINRWPVFTWRFLPYKFVEGVTNPLPFFLDVAKDCFDVHRRML